MQKSDCIIGVEHVSKFFGDKAVLNDVNFNTALSPKNLDTCSTPMMQSDFCIDRFPFTNTD